MRSGLHVALYDQLQPTPVTTHHTSHSTALAPEALCTHLLYAPWHQITRDKHIIEKRCSVALIEIVLEYWRKKLKGTGQSIITK